MRGRCEVHCKRRSASEVLAKSMEILNFPLPEEASSFRLVSSLTRFFQSSRGKTGNPTFRRLRWRDFARGTRRQKKNRPLIPLQVRRSKTNRVRDLRFLVKTDPGPDQFISFLISHRFQSHSFFFHPAAICSKPPLQPSTVSLYFF